MRRTIASGALAALVMFPLAAQAQLLKVVEVGAPAINCVFQTDCNIPVSDTTGNILFPTLDPGTAWLQSRTFAGEAGAPGVGTTGYQYRISLTQASGNSECIKGFNLNFGPHKQLPYKNNQLADVYVVTSGGLGTIGVKSAEKFGDVILFELSAPLWQKARPTSSARPISSGLPRRRRRCTSMRRSSRPALRRSSLSMRACRPIQFRSTPPEACEADASPGKACDGSKFAPAWNSDYLRFASASSTISQTIWPAAMWTCWIKGVFSLGTRTSRSHSASI